MSSTDYIIDVLLILLVFLQIRQRPMDLKSLLLPVVVVAYAGSTYLTSFPSAGNDVALAAVLTVTGVVIGALCGLSTRVWRRADGKVVSQAGALAAVLWLVGVVSRAAFQLYSTHGGAGAVSRFSIHHDITSSQAWVVALVLMAFGEVLARLLVLRIRGHQVGAGAGAESMVRAA
jgi:hypothetical protein